MSQTIVELQIDKKLSMVWMAFVEQTSIWWPKSQFKFKYTQKVEIEEHLNGMLYEDFGKREGFMLAKVTGIKSPNWICLSSTLLNDCRISFHQKDNTTAISILEETGMLTEKELTNMRGYWESILSAFKSYVESEIQI